jgi:AcrR family transcriptional regulator
MWSNEVGSAVGSRADGQRRHPNQARAKVTREHILDTAARLFGERGISMTSTNRIAAEAGVGIGTVYRYFADRDVIVHALLGRMLDNAERRFSAWVADSAKQPTPQLLSVAPQVITEMLHLFAAELVTNSSLVRALIGGVQFYSSGLLEFEPDHRHDRADHRHPRTIFSQRARVSHCLGTVLT